MEASRVCYDEPVQIIQGQTHDTAHIAVSSVLQLASNTVDGETSHKLGLYAGSCAKRLVSPTDRTMQFFDQNVANPI